MIYMPEGILIIKLVTGLCTRNINENPKTLRSPSEHNMSFRDVTIKTKDNEKLHGWFIYQENSHLSKTIVYFHENAGSKNIQILY